MVDYRYTYHCIFIILGFFFVAEGAKNQIGHGWQSAHATFYGDINGGETMNGACGYGNLFEQGYGLETTALSAALFNEGAACGSCYQIKCVDSKWCKQGAGPIRVTATNFCPSGYSKTSESWCNSPRKHFDLAMPMFLKMAEYKGGIVPVLFRRVKCRKQGGVKFELKGNQYWLLVLVYNVGDVGDVAMVDIKGSKTSWTQMQRNWGQNWQTFERLNGQSLSFQITTSNGKTKRFNNVAPENWQLDQTYEAKKNMH